MLKCERARGCNPRNASRKDASSHRQEYVDTSISATGWIQPTPLRAPLVLTHKGPAGESHQQRHHDAGRLEPSLDTGCPCLVCASEVKCLDKPAKGRNGGDCSWQEILPGSGEALLPCSLGDSSLSPSPFCNGPGECCNDTKHCSLLSPLVPGKALPRRSPKYKHFFCISDLQPYLTPQNNARMEGGALPCPLCPGIMPRSGVMAHFLRPPEVSCKR